MSAALLRQVSVADLFSGNSMLTEAVAGERLGRIITTARDLMVHALGSRIRGRPFVQTRKQMIEMLQLMIGFSPVEKLIVFYLDGGGRLIAYRQMLEGSVRGVAIPTRELLLGALHRGAAGLIVAHNHPSGIAEPSASDREATRHLARACLLFEIDLVDHLIVARGEVCSIMN